MNPFDDLAICHKCGGDDIVWSYHPKKEWGDFTNTCQERLEHIHKYCRRCHYDWTEEIASAQKRDRILDECKQKKEK